jgi:hypothetical protein
MTTITLTSSDFWKYVKDDVDCDEILKRLGDRTNLISHFLFFLSLACTIDELNNLNQGEKKK